MKKIILSCLALSALSASAQNVANPNPTGNTDVSIQVALNNSPGPVNNINIADQIQSRPAPQQAAPQQAAPVNRGNFLSSSNENPSGNVRQQKVGQSIKISAGVSGYSGSSGKASVKSHARKSLKMTLLKTFKSKYKAVKHYGHKSRVKKCHKF